MPETDPTSKLETSLDNQKEKEKVREKIHEYFFSKLFSNRPPMQINFEKLGEYFQNIQIKNTLVIDEDGLFKKYGIQGYLVRAIINRQIYILFTESLESTNPVWHGNETEIRFLCNTNGEDSLHVNNINLQKLKDLIETLVLID